MDRCPKAIDDDLSLLLPAWDAVGTLVTERPPHKAVQAAFPHTASTLGV